MCNHKQNSNRGGKRHKVCVQERFIDFRGKFGGHCEDPRQQVTWALPFRLPPGHSKSHPGGPTKGQPRTPPDSGSCQAVSHVIVPMIPPTRQCVFCRGLWPRFLLKTLRGEGEERVVPSRQWSSTSSARHCDSIGVEERRRTPRGDSRWSRCSAPC